MKGSSSSLVQLMAVIMLLAVVQLVKAEDWSRHRRLLFNQQQQAQEEEDLVGSHGFDLKRLLEQLVEAAGGSSSNEARRSLHKVPSSPNPIQNEFKDDVHN